MNAYWQGEAYENPGSLRSCAPPALRPWRAFTLIELLVVISLVALLMTILLPTLARVRKQAKAVACQANRRQWVVMMSTCSAAENRGWHGEIRWWIELRSYAGDETDVWLCPLAREPDPLGPQQPPDRDWKVMGKTFNAWQFNMVGDSTDRQASSDEFLYTSSYGASGLPGICLPLPQSLSLRANVPAMMDSRWFLTSLQPDETPPPCEDAIPSPPMCISRHDGGINVLFADGSVRMVGLKEIWTLKWHKDFNTSGPRTKAGGVQPEDWPAWMRKFTDY